MPSPDYYPKLWELFLLVLNVFLLIWAGNRIKRRWARSEDAMPVPLALGLWAGMFLFYILIAAAFYETAPDRHKLTILMWCLIFWWAPALYYTYMVVQALAVRSVERIGPFSAEIDDPSEFAAARKLALRGDIDGAVALYRGYKDNHTGALFEAARLLKSEKRYSEAEQLFEELMQRFESRERVWAEACYQLAKLKETCLQDAPGAVLLLRQVMRRTPESRFGQLAGADLARLHAFSIQLDEEEDAASPPPLIPADPFFQPRDTGKPETGAEAEPTAEIPVPKHDPFLPPTLKAAVAQKKKATAKKKAKAAPKPKAATKAKPKTKTAPKAKAKPKAKAATKPKATPKPKTAPKAKAATKPKPATKAKPKAKAATKPKAAPKKKIAAKKKPAAG